MSSELQETALWHFAGAQFDEGTRELRVSDETIELEPRPTEVLLLLLRRAPSLVTHAEISEAVWPERHGHLGERTINNNVSKIRAALGDSAKGIIETVPTKGYRVVCEVVREMVRRAPMEYPELKPGEAVRGRPDWILQECLGAGGYGQAWRARNSAGQDHVFKFSFSGRQGTALKREVTLSRILLDTLPEHDDFVPVLDWDFDSVPYFIESEYSGENLSRWEQEHGWLKGAPLNERLDLAVRISRAVAAAHSVGVLHRDLKPENILVQGGGGSPKIRLCDFGAGRLIDPESLDKLKFTALGFSRTVAGDSTAGSLMYVAPEIVRGQPSSVQSDVYSLGIVLYQLVVGDLNRPLATGWESDVADELLRQDIAEATHGNPQARLPSAQLLAARLRSLSARRDALVNSRAEAERAAAALELLRKSKARRPWLIALSVVFAIGFASTIFFAIQARQEAQVAAKKTKVAEQQLHIVDSLNDFLAKNILGAADPVTGMGSGVTVRQALVQSLPDIHNSFGNEPLVEASIDNNIATSLGGVGDWKNAAELLKNGSDLLRQQLGPDSERTLSIERRYAIVLSNLGELNEAEQVIDDILPRMKKVLSPTSHSLFEGRRAEAVLRLAQGRTNEAVQLFSSLLADVVAAGDTSGEQAWIEMSLSEALVDDRQYEEALLKLPIYLAELSKLYGEKAMEPLTVKMYIADAHLHVGQISEAETLLAAITPLIKESGGQDNDTYADAIKLAGDLAGRKGDWKEAVARYQFACAILEKAGAVAATETIECEVAEAEALAHEGRPVEGMDLARQIQAKAKPVRYQQCRVAEAVSVSAILGRDSAAAQDAIRRLTGDCAQLYLNDEEWQGHIAIARATMDLSSGDRRNALSNASKAAILLSRTYGSSDLESSTASRLMSRAQAGST